MADRLPKTLWRVVATGGRRRSYWEPASKQYTARRWATDKAAEYRRQGADVVIYRCDPVWVVDDEEVAGGR